MQVVQANIDITTGMHLFETPYDIIINSQIYDKTTMLPKPYKFFNVNDESKLHNLLSRSSNNIGDANGQMHLPTNYNHVIYDLLYTDIFYMLKQGVLYKFQYNNEEYDLVKSANVISISGAGGANYRGQKYLHQTKDYIIVAEMNSGGPAIKNIGITRINKENFAVNGKTLGGCTFGDIYLLKADQDYMYFMLFSLSNPDGSYRIYRYNINTDALDLLHTREFTINTCIGKCTPVTFNGYHYILAANEAGNAYSFIRYHIDYEGHVTEEFFDIEYDATKWPFQTIGKLGITKKDCFALSLYNVDNQYIACTAHNVQNSYQHDNIDLRKLHRHMIFKIDGEDIVQKDIFSINDLCYGVLYYDKHTVVFHTDAGYKFYKFDTDFEEYTPCFRKTGAFTYVGLDTMNRLYTINAANKMTIVSNVTACILDAHFQEEAYDFSSGVVRTAVLFSAKNFLNAYIKAEVELVLNGPCAFYDGTTRKKLTTSASGETGVVVDILRGGKIDVIIKQVGVDK